MKNELLKPGSVILDLDPNQINVGWRAREDLDAKDIEDLASDIQKNGQMQPILVRKTSEGYTLIAGRRRTLACASLEVSVKCLVVAPTDVHHAFDLQLSENLLRQDFDLLELGEMLKKKKELLIAQPGNDSSERFTLIVAKKFNRSESWIRDVLIVADFTGKEKAEIREGKTPSERNKKARAQVGKRKKQKKRQKLVEKAETKQADREKESKEKVQPENHNKKDLGTLKGGPNIRLFHEDFKKTLAREEIAKKYFDLCLTDPPYGLDWSKITHTERGSINEDVSWDELDVSWVKDVTPFMSDDSSFLIFSPLEMLGEYKKILTSQGFQYRCSIIWHKTNPGVVHRDTYLSSCEAIVWATKGKPHFTPWKNCGDVEVHNHFTSPICAGHERLEHPTQKPIKIIQSLLKRHSAEGHRVFDPFMGVGTTASACHLLDRVCVSSDLDKEFYDLSVLRLRSL